MPGPPGRQLGGHRSGELRIDERREGRPVTGAVGPLGCDEAGIVRLVPGAPPGQLHMFATTQGDQVGDQRPVGGKGARRQWAGEGFVVFAFASVRCGRRPGGCAEDVQDDLVATRLGTLAGGDRGELARDSRVGRAGAQFADASGDVPFKRRRAARIGLERGPVDEQPDVGRMQGRQLAAGGGEGGRCGRCARRGRVPEDLGVVLGQAQRRTRRRRFRDGDGGGRAGGAARAGGETRGREQGDGRGETPRAPARQPEPPQTAETCSSSATLKEEPQPQAATTFGLLTLKPAPWRLSS